jgi:surfeit locus 1 family protein
VSELRRSAKGRWLLAGLAFAGLLLFTALGIWQVERRTWKLALIEAVDERIHAPPVTAPSLSDWRRRPASDWQYRHVMIVGRFQHDRETLVQAVTEQGNGFWVLTPVVTPNGVTVLVNRGFVPPERADRRTRAAALPLGPARVAGLLRLSEPGGRVLRPNRPAEDRWYSRDVAAIAARRGLTAVMPYFIDADATPIPGSWPSGGMTVVSFPNNHLVYALTWFSLAILCGYALVLVRRR